MSRFDVVGIGINAIDILFRTPVGAIEAGEKYEVPDLGFQGGGPAANGICVASNLGFSAAFLCHLSDNAASAIAREQFRRHGVSDALFVETEGASPPISLVQTDPVTAERTIFYNLSGVVHPAASDLNVEVLRSARVLLVDSYEADVAIAAMEAVAGSDVQTVVDIEPGTPEQRRRMLALATHAVLPWKTAEALSGTTGIEPMMAALSVISRAQLVITHGIEGSWARHPDGSILHQTAFPVEAVDTCGCGDAYHGAYVVGLLAGWSLAHRLEFASWVASRVATEMGGRSVLLKLRDLDSLDTAPLSEGLKALLDALSD